MFATKNTQHHSKGQSLVETALFLPILIILLGGLVEVSNLLVTQNRVATAARAGTGFAAANYRGDDWNDTDTWPVAMANAAKNNVTDTLDLDEERWDIYVVKATLNPDGSEFTEWNDEHAYGTGAVVTEDEWNDREQEMQNAVIDALSDSELGLEIVATLAFHDRQSLLGLNAFNFGPLTEVRGVSVMRVDEQPAYAGCAVLPISVALNQFSAYPSNWPVGESYDGAHPDDPADESQIFPTNVTYPGDLVYVNEPGAAPDRLNTDTFTRNIPGVPLLEADEGYLYWARQSEGSGSFGWLRWTGPGSARNLGESLAFPGDFHEKYPGGDADMDRIDSGPDDVSGDGDGILEVGEWVQTSTGEIASNHVRPVIRDYVEKQQPVTLLVYDITNGQTGQNRTYRVAGFVEVVLQGYVTSGSPSERGIIFEFVRFANECLELQ
ncbi:MAG: TadE/TadG family type IV pilus assembly protein [Chloroflexota bacterium]